MHGEDGSTSRFSRATAWRHFVHQFWVVEAAIFVQRERVTGVEQLVLRKIDHVLAFGSGAANRIQLHAISPVPTTVFPETVRQAVALFTRSASSATSERCSASGSMVCGASIRRSSSG